MLDSLSFSDFRNGSILWRQTESNIKQTGNFNPAEMKGTDMAVRKFNFNPGPATLPLQVLEEARDSMVEFRDMGMSILEISHRSKEFDDILNGTKSLVRELLGVPDDYSVFFVQGGASTQFFTVPMNLAPEGSGPSYINTGSWAAKAIKEAKKLRPETRVIISTEEDGIFTRVPSPGEVVVPEDSPYLHLTSNNTIFGTQFETFPDSGGVPLIVDMSSDIFSRPVDVGKLSMIYAGAQKNLGPSGVTLVIIKDDLAKRCPDTLPTMVNYKTHIEKNSLFNTPPVFPIYICKLVLEWVKQNGGLEGIGRINQQKGELLYGAIDEMSGFYSDTAEKSSRSLMNATFRLPTESLEKAFLAEAAESNFHGLKGHRSVGGIRVSMYNALPLEGIEMLVRFMRDFAAANC